MDQRNSINGYVQIFQKLSEQSIVDLKITTKKASSSDEAFVLMLAGEISHSDELMNERHGCRTGLISRDAVGRDGRVD